MEIVTRQGREADAEGVALAHAVGWQVAYRGIVPDEYLDNMDMEARTRNWAEILAGQHTPEGMAKPTDLVVEVDGAVAGFANVGCWRGAPNDASFGELWAMYVHPDYWGAGAGYALMTATVGELQRQGCSTAYLWVIAENDRARRFYERQGWADDKVTQVEELAGTQITEVRYSITI